MDIPIYREFEDENGNTVTELAGENGWTRSNPTRVNEWIEEVVAEKNKRIAGAGSQMRRMVKFTKRFCRSRNADTNADWDLPNGMKLTMLVVECYAWRDRDDKAIHTLFPALKNRLTWSSLEIENLADTNWPKAKLTKTTSDQNVLNLRDHLGEALTELAVLFSTDCDETKARRAWDWVFQSDGFFKELEEEAKAEAKRRALLEKASLLSVGNAGTDRFGRIVAASTASIPNLAHAFYGEDFSATDK